MKTFNSIAVTSALVLMLSVGADAQFGASLSTNLEKSSNISVVTVATNEPGKFIPGIPLSGTSDIWTGIRVHFRRHDRATDYRVEVTYLKNGIEGTVVAYVRENPVVVNGDGYDMLEGVDVKIAKDTFDFTVTRVWVSPLRPISETSRNR
jgi:hypothetical protein